MAHRPVAARRPLVAVCGPDRGGDAAWLFTALAIWRAGGRPCRITPANPCDPETFDALVLGGGADVDPLRYGEEFDGLEELAAEAREAPAGLRLFTRLFYPLLFGLRILLGRSAAVRAAGRLDEARDELEFLLLERALQRGVPVLGICRGEQLINVHYGGRLLRDVRPFHEETTHLRTVLPRKVVNVAPQSLLARAMQADGRLRVNALHEQAVCCLGQGLRAVAMEDNGVVQAVEDPSRPFVLGVQWHPEFLPQLPRQQAIFRALVRAAARAA